MCWQSNDSADDQDLNRHQIGCECSRHQHRRALSRKARETVDAMFAAVEEGDEDEAIRLFTELTKLNDAVNS